MSDVPGLAAITAWLAGEVRFLGDSGAVLEAVADRLLSEGLPLGRASLHIRALHPRYGGVSRVWRPGEPLEERFFAHGVETTPLYQDSPVRMVVEARERLDWHLDQAEPLPFPILRELREQGFSHYVIVPVIYADRAVNAIAWVTRRPGGFTSEQLHFFDAVLPVLSSVMEIQSLRRFVRTVLATYVGEDAGQLVLRGQIHRGDVHAITAGLLLVDLRDFTLLSDRLSPRDVMSMLSRYFDCVIPPIEEHGGEVMEIMGDGVLAIFNQSDGCDPSSACAHALAAARDGLAAVAAANRARRPEDAELHAGVALHYGTVSYGNIGAGDRLDFTVIGPDVNLTSRIERLCRELDRDLLMSEKFVETLGQPMFALGHFELRGFARMQRLFALPPQEF